MACWCGLPEEHAHSVDAVFVGGAPLPVFSRSESVPGPISFCPFWSDGAHLYSPVESGYAIRSRPTEKVCACGSIIHARRGG